MEAKPEETPLWLLVAVALLIQLSLSGYQVISSVALSNKVNPFVFALYGYVASSLLMVALAVLMEGPSAAFAPLRYLLLLFTTDASEDEQRVDSSSDVRSAATPPPQRRTRCVTFLLFLAAGVCSFGTIVGTVVALKLIPSDVFSTYEPTIPVFTTVVAVACGYEARPNALVAAGVLCAVAGAVLVEVLNSSQNNGGNVPGNVVVVGQCLATGCLLVVTRPLTDDWSPLVVTAGYYVVGALLTLVVCLAARIPAADWCLGGCAGDDGESSVAEAWGAEVYSVLVATVFAYEAFSWLVQRASPTFTAAFIPAQPVFTILLNYLILGRGLGLPTAVAGLVVIVGLALTVYGKTFVVARESPPPPLLVSFSVEGSDDDDDEDDDKRTVVSALIVQSSSYDPKDGAYTFLRPPRDDDEESKEEPLSW